MTTFKDYYTNQFYVSLHAHRRTLFQGIILLLWKQAAIIYISLSGQVVDRIADSEGDSFSDSWRIYLDVDSLTESRDKNINKLKNIVYVVLALNIVLILLLIADFISYARRDRSNEGYETSYGFTTLLFSFIAKLYCYTVYLPSIYASLRIANYSNDPVGITNIVLTIIIMCCLEIHDFDYALYKEDQDFLARFPLMFIHLAKIFFLFALAFNKAIVKWDIQEVGAIIFACFNIALQIAYREFHSRGARKIRMNLMVYLGVSGGILLLHRIGSIKSSIFVQLLCYFPLSFKIGSDIEDYFSDPMRGHLKQLQDNHKNRQIGSSLFYIQDLLIQIERFSFVDYFLNPHSILLESISTEHTENCQKAVCFCSSTKKLKKHEREDRRKRHLVLHIDSIFQDILAQKQTLIPSHFYYINFLVDQWRSKSNSLYYLETLRSKLHKAPLLLRIYYAYSMKKIYALYARDYQASCQEVVGLVFEDILKEAAQQYESSLYLKIQLLGLLNSDHVFTELVQKCAFQLYQARSALRIKLGYLARINEDNPQLKMIHNGYAHNFCLIPSSRINDLSSLRMSNQGFDMDITGTNQKEDKTTPPGDNKTNNPNTNYTNNIINNKKYNLNMLEDSPMQTNLKVFQENFCVLFLSAQHSSLGVIRKAQSSFLDILNISDPVGKPINTFIPTTMTAAHNQEIQNFLNCKEKSYPSVVENPLVLAKTADNFAVPISIRLSLDHVSQFGQIGFVCSIEAIRDASYYLLLSSHSMTLHLMCEHFSKQYHIKSFPNANEGKISAAKMFPQLKVPSFFEAAKRGFKDTLMILPGVSFFKKSDSPLPRNFFMAHSSLDSFTKLSETDILSLTRYLHFYVVSLRVEVFNNQSIPCFVTVLQNIEHVLNIFEIHPFIQQIQAELMQVSKGTEDTSAKTGFAGASEYSHQMDSQSYNLRQGTTLLNTSRLNKLQTFNQQSSLFDRHSMRFEELQINNIAKQSPILQGNPSSQLLKSKKSKIHSNNNQQEIVSHGKQQPQPQQQQQQLGEETMINQEFYFDNSQYIPSNNTPILSFQNDPNQQLSQSKDASLINHSRSLQPSLQNLKGQEDYENFVQDETRRTAGVDQFQGLPQMSTRDDIGLHSNRYFNNNSYNDFLASNANQIFSQQPYQISSTARHNYQNLGATNNINNNGFPGEQLNINYPIDDKFEEQMKYEVLHEKEQITRDKSKSLESPKLMKKNEPNVDKNAQTKPELQVKQTNSKKAPVLFGREGSQSSYKLAMKKQQQQDPTGSSNSQTRLQKLQSQTTLTKNNNDDSQNNPQLKSRNNNNQNNKEDESFGGGSLRNTISEQHRESSNSAQAGRQVEMNDKSSVNGSRGSTKEVLKQVERKIMVARRNTGLQMLNFMGFLSVVLIIVMIFIQELNILQAFTKASIDFTFVSWPMEISSQLSQIQYYVLMYYMNVLYLFPRLTASWTTYAKTCISQIGYSSGNFTRLWIDQANSQDQYSPYFTTLLNNDVSWIAKRDAKSFKNQTVLLHAQQFYFEQNYLNAYKTYLIMQSDNFNQQAILIDNIALYQSQMLTLKQTIKDSSISSLNNILTNTMILMVLCITLSFLVIALIFPMYAYIQYQTEQIYKLMSTISSNSLLNMQSQLQTALKHFVAINAVDKHHSLVKSITANSPRHPNINSTNNKNNNANKNSLAQHSSFFQSTKKNFLVLSMDKQRKKRNISSTEALRKFSWPLLGIGCAVFVFVIFLPILHNFLIDTFKTESILNVNVLYSLYNLKNLFSQSIYLTLGNIYWKMAPVIGGMYQGSYFQSQIPSVLANDEVSLSDMTSIIASSSTQSRFDDSDYRAFFYPIITTSVCSTLESHQGFYNVTKYNLNLATCKSIEGGILEKGFQTASRYFFDFMAPAYQVATLTTYSSTAVMQTTLKAWEASVNLKDLNTFFEIMTIIITILKDFMQSKGDKYLSQMQVIEYLLAALQISVLFVVFALWWFMFYRRMSEVINQNRRLLSLFEISLVMENSYILSYLNSLK